MRLMCKLCGNQSKFEAEARAKVIVLIDGQGNIISDIPSKRVLGDVVVLGVVNCKSCASPGSIVDLDAQPEEKS